MQTDSFFNISRVYYNLLVHGKEILTLFDTPHHLSRETESFKYQRPGVQCRPCVQFATGSYSLLESVEAG